jgi:hypothetical protein
MQRNYSVTETRNYESYKEYLKNLPDILTVHLTHEQLQAISIYLG